MIRAGIKIEGDSTDAQQALRALERATERTADEMRRMAGEAVKIGAAVAGAGTLEEAFRRVVDATRASIIAYATANEEARHSVNELSEAAKGLQERFGEVFVGGENLERISIGLTDAFGELEGALGALDSDMQAFTRDTVASAAGTLSELAQALLTIRSVMELASEGFAVFAEDGGRADRAIKALQSSMVQAVNPVAKMREQFRDLADIASGLFRAAESVTRGFSRFDDQIQASTDAQDAFDRAAQTVTDTVQNGISPIREARAAFDEWLDTVREMAPEGLTAAQAVDQITASFDRFFDGFERAQRQQAGTSDRLADLTAAKAESARMSAEAMAIEAKEEERLALAREAGLATLQRLKQAQAEISAAESRDAVKRAELDAVLAEQRAAEEAEQLRRLEQMRQAELAVRDARFGAADAFLGAAQSITAGSKKMAKAYRISKGAELAADGIKAAIESAIAFANYNYPQGIALAAASTAAFAAAAQLGFSGGKGGGGGGGQTINTVNQEITFTGNVDQGTAVNVAAAVRDQTRRGIADGTGGR